MEQNRVHPRPIHEIHEHGIPPFSLVYELDTKMFNNKQYTSLPRIDTTFDSLQISKAKISVLHLPLPSSSTHLNARHVRGGQRQTLSHCFSPSDHDSRKKCRPRRRFPRILFDWFIIRRVVSWRPIDMKQSIHSSVALNIYWALDRIFLELVQYDLKDLDFNNIQKNVKFGSGG